jgi:hypothetical protein
VHAAWMCKHTHHCPPTTLRAPADRPESIANYSLVHNATEHYSQYVFQHISSTAVCRSQQFLTCAP